jgi:hypothetical protein
MKTSFATFAPVVVVMGIIMAVGSQLTINRLVDATAKQCRTHDWPVEAHRIHMDWCRSNGYATN